MSIPVNRILRGDALDVLRGMPDGCVSCQSRRLTWAQNVVYLAYVKLRMRMVWKEFYAEGVRFSADPLLFPSVLSRLEPKTREPRGMLYLRPTTVEQRTQCPPQSCNGIQAWPETRDLSSRRRDHGTKLQRRETANLREDRRTEQVGVAMQGRVGSGIRQVTKRLAYTSSRQGHAERRPTQPCRNLPRLSLARTSARVRGTEIGRFTTQGEGFIDSPAYCKMAEKRLADTLPLFGDSGENAADPAPAPLTNAELPLQLIQYDKSSKSA